MRRAKRARCSSCAVRPRLEAMVVGDGWRESREKVKRMMEKRREFEAIGHPLYIALARTHVHLAYSLTGLFVRALSERLVFRIHLFVRALNKQLVFRIHLFVRALSKRLVFRIHF